MKKRFLICLAIFIALLLFAVKIAFSAEDWHSPTSVHSFCCEYEGVGDAVDFIDGDTDSYWRTIDGDVIHWIILDMGQTYAISKVQQYHKIYQTWAEPIIYVSDDPENFGDSVGASSANYYTDPTGWDEIDITDKSGRYIKVVGNAETNYYWYEFQIYGEVAGAPPEAPEVQSQILILD